MEPPCSHCDRPDSSLLRVVLIGEVIRADEGTLGVLAEVFQALGLLGPEEEEVASAQGGDQRRSLLRLVK